MSEAKKSALAKAGETFDLARFTPYRIVALGHAISRKLAQTYRDENITIPEWRVLAVISQADAMAARDVVAMTPMDKMAVSRAVAGLEEKGLVLRESSAEDKRVSMLSLSVEGRKLFDHIAGLATAYEQGLLSCLDEKEAAMFDKAMSKLEAQAAETPLSVVDESES